jgi:hypothetical protein
MSGTIVQEHINFDEIEAQIIKRKSEIKTEEPAEIKPALSLSKAYAELSALDSVSEPTEPKKASEYNKQVMPELSKTPVMAFDEYDFSDMMFDGFSDKGSGTLSKELSHAFHTDSTPHNADLADWFWADDDEDTKESVPAKGKSEVPDLNAVIRSARDTTGTIELLREEVECLSANTSEEAENIKKLLMLVRRGQKDLQAEVSKIRETQEKILELLTKKSEP